MCAVGERDEDFNGLSLLALGPVYDLPTCNPAFHGVTVPRSVLAASYRNSQCALHLGPTGQ